MSLSILSGHVAATLLATAMATLLVVRQASAPLLTAYAGGFLIYIAAAVSYANERPMIVARSLLVAVIAGGIGLLLRLMHARREQLERKLTEQAEQQRQAILAERRWIADELHDSIAHHLTIISLHSQLLDDEIMRPTSAEAIKVAARNALTDIRFVIKLAESAPAGGEVPLGDLAKAIEEARNEFGAAGHTTVLEGNPADEMISRGVDIILAHVVRESATNILKYAGPGEVRFLLNVAPDAIVLEIHSPLSSDGPRVKSSTGTGLNRMAERVLGVSGEFTAGPDNGMWVVSARLPIEAANGAASSHPGRTSHP
ncbi:MAG: histidine kinase [Ancrocorticia sp.]